MYSYDSILSWNQIIKNKLKLDLFTNILFSLQKFQNSLKPSKDWGPKDKALRQEWKDTHADRKNLILEKKQLKKKMKQKQWLSSFVLILFTIEKNVCFKDGNLILWFWNF